MLLRLTAHCSGSILATFDSIDMHFRLRHNVVQVIRTTYDPSTKKPRTEIVGRLARHEPAVGDDLRRTCSTAEIEEVEAWIANSLRADAVASEHAARTLAEQMERSGEWFAASPAHPGAQQLAAEVQQQWVRLRNRLRRHGLIE